MKAHIVITAACLMAACTTPSTDPAVESDPARVVGRPECRELSVTERGFCDEFSRGCPPRRTTCDIGGGDYDAKGESDMNRTVRGSPTH